MQASRSLKRSAHLTVEVARAGAYMGDIYTLPEIKLGDLTNARHKLRDLSDQRLIDDETEQRLAMLIRDFGVFTA